MGKLKKLPHFKSEDEERDFWSTHSSMDYIDWSKAERIVLPNMKRSGHIIPVRVSDETFDRLKIAAKKENSSRSAIAKKIVQQGAKALVASPGRRSK